MSFTDYELAHRQDNHKFFSHVNAVLDWHPINKRLNEVYVKGKAANGRPSHSGSLLFKMLLIQTWYGLSDEGVETMVGDSLSCMKFCGLSMADVVPDHSTISRFRKALNTNQAFDGLLEMINIQLENKGLKVNNGRAVVDASITESERKPKGQTQWEVVAGSDRGDDPDDVENGRQQDIKIKAVKVIQKGVDTEGRWVKKGKKSYFGYKRHIMTDEQGMIECVHTTAANTPDNEGLEPLILKAIPKKIKEICADKGYYGGYYDDMLVHYDIRNRIMRKAVKNRPLNHWEKVFNRLISKRRYVVERTFGGLKKWFCAGTARYVGVVKTHGQHVLEAIAHNLFRIKGQVRLNIC
jgi:IS5 family transposase